VRGNLPLLPYLLALAMSANVGSVGTLVGNPQNMIIGQLSRLPFARFSASMLPAAARRSHHPICRAPPRLSRRTAQRDYRGAYYAVVPGVKLGASQAPAYEPQSGGCDSACSQRIHK